MDTHIYLCERGVPGRTIPGPVGYLRPGVVLQDPLREQGGVTTGLDGSVPASGAERRQTADEGPGLGDRG